MKIDKLLRENGCSLSFEFFPPKDTIGETRLFSVVNSLRQFNPTFVSITYGAGGSSSKNTLHITKRIKEEASLNPMPHITCVNQSREEVEAMLKNYKSIGVDNIMALRGDPPLNEQGEPVKPASHFYASDLVKWIKEIGGFSIGVAFYPEGHVDSKSLDDDIGYAKEKTYAGADFGVTQLFFDNRHYYGLLERAYRVGINIPIIASIMPVSNLASLRTLCLRCGASLPTLFERRLELSVTKEDADKFGIEFACRQIDDLLNNGVKYFHFYTMNRSEAILKIIANVGLHRFGIK